MTILRNENGQNDKNECKQTDIYIYIDTHIKWLYFILWLNKWFFFFIFCKMTAFYLLGLSILNINFSIYILYLSCFSILIKSLSIFILYFSDKLYIYVMFGMHILKNCVHCNHSVITIHLIWRFDAIVVMFGWLYLIWNMMWLLLCLVYCISSEI